MCVGFPERTAQFSVRQTTGKDSSVAWAIACQNCAVYSVFPSGMTSDSKIAQFNWECIASFILLQNIQTVSAAQATSVRGVESSWNVMTHGDAREGKWRGNWRMEWVASILHTTSEHGESNITTADALTSAASSRMNWRPPADLNGLGRFTERRNLVPARVPSHLKRSLLQFFFPGSKTAQAPRLVSKLIRGSKPPLASTRLHGKVLTLWRRNFLLNFSTPCI